MLTTLALLAGCTLGNFGQPADLAEAFPEATFDEDGLVVADSIDLVAQASPRMATVVVVSWDYQPADVVYVTNGVTRRTTATAAGSAYEAKLIGATEDSELTLWLEGTVDGFDFQSEPLSV
jgi:hypothetical protein